MSYEIIVLTLLLGSFFGITAIIFRKIPILAELPEINEGRINEGYLSKMTNKIKGLNHSKLFSFDIFLQKILSKIRILTLKLESKTSNCLQKLREKSQQKNLDNGNYWEQLKNSAKKGKK